MITFVSYVPGARGKFIAEICDLSKLKDDKLDDSLYRHSQESGGQVQWTKALIPYFEQVNLGYANIHGIFPEKENYKQYIDIIIDGLEQANAQNCTVDIHYIEKDSLEYILGRGAKVIRVTVTRSAQASKLQNDFFYKNFIAGINETVDESHKILMREQQLVLARKIIDENYNNDRTWVPKYLLDLAKSKFDLPLSQWGVDGLTVLYKCCGGLNRQLQKPNIVTHDNLFEIEISDVLNFDNIVKIVNFVGGQVNDDVINRFNSYIKQQETIPKFNDYINDFAKC